MQQYPILFSVDNFTHRYAETLMDASRKSARSKHRKPKFMFMWCHLNMKQRYHMRFEGITGAMLKMQAFRGVMTCWMVTMYQLTWHNIPENLTKTTVIKKSSVSIISSNVKEWQKQIKSAQTNWQQTKFWKCSPPIISKWNYLKYFHIYSGCFKSAADENIWTG